MIRMQKLGYALGSDIALTVVMKDEGKAKEYLEIIWAMIIAFENRFSRFLVDSELSQFNAHAGIETKVSPAFRKLLLAAQDYSMKTDGLYNPFILPSLNRTGYIGSWPNIGDYNPLLNYSIKHVHEINKLNIKKSSAIIPVNSALDFGGIGKGYLLDELSRYLEKSKVDNYWLSLGGDIIAAGHDLESISWKIGIADANDEEVDIKIIDNKGKKIAIATSGTIKRKGLGWHHIIDPRTGLSASTDVLTVTVIANPPAVEGTEADIYAKCLVILGSEEAEAFAQSKDITAIVQTLVNSGKKALHYGKKL